MIHHPRLKILLINSSSAETPLFWEKMADDIAHLSVDLEDRLSSTLDEYDSVITVGSVSPEEAEVILRFVTAGGGWLVMPMLSENPLPEPFGVQLLPVGPKTDLRILFDNADHPLAARLPDAIYVGGCYQPLQIGDSTVETLLYTDWHYTHQPVFTVKKEGEGYLACITLQDYSQSMLPQVCYRLLRSWHGSAPPPEKSLGVGILGYAPSVGLPHGLAVGATSGLHLQGICDLSLARREQGARDFPEVKVFASSQELAADPDIDLVIIATAPNIHARLSIEMLEAGKHVLCEKPLALTRAETAAMVEAAVRNRVHLSCHQNRRWDPDFRYIQQCVHDNRLGEVFHLESFVGSFHHPCGYWHSDSGVSGGTSFDWGAHYLDWIVGLLGTEIEAVLGSRHKRVWHDVTNADQERIQIRFRNGCEAEFIHSDIAAAAKPKWYILGTKGALVGKWRDISAYEADPTYYFQQTDIPPTEMMPAIELTLRLPSGEFDRISPQLPERDPFSFHRNLADHLLWGETLAAPLADSVKVVALLEAAARSMANNSRWEVIGDG